MTPEPNPMPSLFLPADAEPGLTEHQVRTGISDLVRLHGFEEARKLVALWLWNEAEGIRNKEAA